MYEGHRRWITVEAVKGDGFPALDENLPGNLAAASNARRKLEVLRDVLPETPFEDARLLVNELVTNSLRHAGALDGGQIKLRVDVSSHLLRIEVTDKGPGFVPRVVEPTLEQTSGRGLFLIEQLSDRWGVIEDDGTTVWAEIELG